MFGYHPGRCNVGACCLIWRWKCYKAKRSSPNLKHYCFSPLRLHIFSLFSYSAGWEKLLHICDRFLSTLKRTNQHQAWTSQINLAVPRSCIVLLPTKPVSSWKEKVPVYFKFHQKKINRNFEMLQNCILRGHLIQAIPLHNVFVTTPCLSCSTIHASAIGFIPVSGELQVELLQSHLMCSGWTPSLIS